MNINIYEFYWTNVEKSDYFYKFSTEIGSHILYIKEEELKFFDDDEIIEKFKSLCQPRNNYSNLDNTKFILICYYLMKNNYYIKQFPLYLEKTIKSQDFDKLGYFAYDVVRNYLFKQGKQDIKGRITWQVRKDLINELEFIKTKEVYNVDKSIDSMIRKISPRNASFNDMPIDEKLSTICNLIELLLKGSNNKFETINYEDFAFNFIDNEDIKKYRKKIQCFRHASLNSLEERKQFSNEQKEFLVDYGYLICKHINSNKNKTFN